MAGTNIKKMTKSTTNVGSNNTINWITKSIGVYNGSGGGGGGDIGTVDTEMSDTSTNAVENKVIKTYVDAGLATKQNIEDNSLLTTNKVVTSAINEVYSKAGASLILSIDPATFVLTAYLQNSLGTQVGSTQTIDLPLESVVVDGAYNAETKEVELTLQNGNKVSFSVADLVNGLQSEITDSNKLSADLVDDSTTTNKFVTAEEKSALANLPNFTVSDVTVDN